jgi:hypothetical protein
MAVLLWKRGAQSSFSTDPPNLRRRSKEWRLAILSSRVRLHSNRIWQRRGRDAFFTILLETGEQIFGNRAGFTHQALLPSEFIRGNPMAKHRDSPVMFPQVGSRTACLKDSKT